MKRWYAIQVRTGKENEVSDAIVAQGYETCLPMRVMIERRSGKWTQVKRNMLQGYALARLDMSVKAYSTLRAIDGVIRFLGTTMPESIPDDQMEHMMILANGGNPWEPSAGHMDGNKLVIDSGPLSGHEDWIAELDARRKRVKVEVSLLKEPVSIELAIEVTGKQAEPEGDSSPAAETAE